jgi:hypothetical protein
VSDGVGSRFDRAVGRRTLGAALRPVGRVALWALLCILLVRGAVDVLGPPAGQAPSPGGEGAIDRAGTAFAIRFARTYLEAPSPKSLDPYLAAGAKIGAGRPPSARGAEVAQAEVVHFSDVGDGRAVVTVACELRDSRTLYLAVPIVRHGAGEVAALGAPSIVAVPAVAGADPERPRPPAGSGASQIRELVEKFLPAYLSAKEESDLRYYLAPGASVVPLGGALHLLGTPTVDQLEGGEGPERELIASARVEEPASGAGYPLAYRLKVRERGGRWYVAGVEGAVS